MVQQGGLTCFRCGDACYGDVVHLGGQYYHQYCFTCKKCNIDLVETGYFEVDGEFYCNDDYHTIKGTQCDGCGKFIEGEAVSAVNSNFHQECFGCHRCGKLFPPGANIIFDGEDFLCETCDNPTTPRTSSSEMLNSPDVHVQMDRIHDAPVHRMQDAPVHRMQDAHVHRIQDAPVHRMQDASVHRMQDAPVHRIQEAPVHQIQEAPVERTPPKEVNSEPPHYQTGHVNRMPIRQTEVKDDEDPNCCAGCGNDIKSGQALLALEKQWHLWCFTCHKCGCLLAGEYMGRDGVPYCEQDYQAEFGVTCAGCGGYITGKVLQAGEKHYHPHCSRCAKCGNMFGEGEEMYLQGSEIWHPHCSEEYQRENEELEKAAMESGKPNGGLSHIETYSLGVTEAQTPQRSPNISLRGEENGVNGYNDGNRNNRISYSSEGSSENRNFSQPPGYNDYLKSKENSMDIRNNNNDSWNPPPKTETKPLPAYDDFVKNKKVTPPTGYRSVKPPDVYDPPPPVYNPPPPVYNPSQSQQQRSFEKPPSPNVSDDEAPPPVPPPPTRSSSTAWKQKYAGQPVQRRSESSPPSNRKNRGSMSFVDSAAARKGSSDQQTMQNGRTNISVSSLRTTSTSSSNEGRDDRDSANNDTFNRKIVQKGVGFNKLQLRKSLVGPPNGMPTTKKLDADALKKLNSDPNGNTHPYEVLKTTSYKTPLHVNRMILETYLTDDEFYDVFQMNRSKFYSLPKWKQEDLKKKATLF